MCGIAGIWNSKTNFNAGLAARRMATAIRHRGPDDSGEWWDRRDAIALAHRRLAILDLSPDGRQPMVSPSGRFVVVFNGEVFNFGELRKELDGTKWRGHSDTEVMLAAFDKWGVDAAVLRFIGMFAFAVLDRERRELLLVRDRIGIKPLYYGWTRSGLVFASELAAICRAPDFEGTIDPGALALLMRHNYVPHPYTIYQGIYKLPPGTALRVSGPLHKTEPLAYWSAREVAEGGASSPLQDTPETAIEKLEALLRDSVRLRMFSDVPIGAFLSGGIDSSTVVSLMQSLSSRPVRTFSIGFDEPGFNEAPHAAAVARHLRTDHTELYITSRETQAVIPQLPEFYDEPFADSSQIPTYLVSRLARESVTVALSGDGGDELFAGYPRYAITAKLLASLQLAPAIARKASSRILEAVSGAALDRGFRASSLVLPAKLRHFKPSRHVQRIVNLLRTECPDLVYRSVVSHWDRPDEILMNAAEGLTAFTDPDRKARLADPISRMMYTDLISYLPDDILTKVDRASMAVSLEVRVPLLDHRVVEFAWHLPMSLRIRDGKEKWILRQVLSRYVPGELVDRPKMGFGIPIGEWLRGPLREWAEDLLAPRHLRQESIFHPQVVEQTWRQHLSRERNHQYQLWNILVFQSWRRHSIERHASNAAAYS